MSTRIKVFNYVMNADPKEVSATLDEARALLASRKARETRIASSVGAKAAATAKKNQAASAKAAKASKKATNGKEAPAVPAVPDSQAATL